MSTSSLTSDQLDDLQSFLKDWLRHTGRTKADLRRALQASSIRMPVLLEELAGAELAVIESGALKQGPEPMGWGHHGCNSLESELAAVPWPT